MNRIILAVAAVAAFFAASISFAGGSPVREIAVKVSGGKYHPPTVTVAKGERVRLNFTRDSKPTCGDVLLIPALGIRKEIPVGKVTSVELTAPKSGKLEWTCGMKMMKGAVVVK